MSHIKGPWSHDDLSVYFKTESGEVPIADLYLYENGETEENARLIAAAPHLAEALNEVLNEHFQLLCDTGGQMMLSERTYNLAMSALVRASISGYAEHLDKEAGE
jgi:hypothetical protein